MLAEVMQLAAPLRGALTAIEVLVFAVALLHAPWRQLFAVPARQHLLFGAVLFLVLLTSGVLRLAVRYGPRNLYVYLLGAGFLGGAASMLGCHLAMLGLLWLSGARAAVSHWSPELLVVLMYPEGFVNGTLVTVLAVYVPGWMRTFDDDHFLPR